MRCLTAPAILAATAMLWNVSAVAPAAAESPNAAMQASSKSRTASEPSEFSAQRRHYRRAGHVRYHRRAYAQYRPYHYRAYYRPHYRAYHRPYYRPYRTFSTLGVYRPWYRPYYGAYYRPAYSYYRPLGYGWPYYNRYYGPRTYVSVGFGPFSFGVF